MGSIVYTDKIEYFNKLAPDWDRAVGNDSDRIAILTGQINEMNIKCGDTVMDLGCGTGILIPLIENMITPTGTIIAIDASPNMINVAREKNSKYNNIEYYSNIIEETDFPENSFDCIIAFAVFPHIENKTAALQKLRKCIKPDGRLYIFHLSDTESLNSFHADLDAPVSRDRLPGREDMQQLLTGSGFTVQKYRDMSGLNFIEATPCYT